MYELEETFGLHEVSQPMNAEVFEVKLPTGRDDSMGSFRDKNLAWLGRLSDAGTPIHDWPVIIARPRLGSAQMHSDPQGDSVKSGVARGGYHKGSSRLKSIFRFAKHAEVAVPFASFLEEFAMKSRKGLFADLIKVRHGTSHLL